MFTKQMHQETDAEKEVLDLKRMQVIKNFFLKKKIFTKINIFTVNSRGIISLFVVILFVVY